MADRQIWDLQDAAYLSQLDRQKPVLATGDYNVAHKEIDLANPASNRQSQVLQMKNVKALNLLAHGFTDTFRHLHGDVLKRLYLVGTT